MLFIFVFVSNAGAMAKKTLVELGLGVCLKPRRYDVRRSQRESRGDELLITYLTVHLLHNPEVPTRLVLVADSLRLLKHIMQQSLKFPKPKDKSLPMQMPH